MGSPCSSASHLVDTIRKNQHSSEVPMLQTSNGASSLCSSHPVNGSLKPSQMSAAGPSSSNSECSNGPSSRAVLNTQGRFVECKGFHSFDSLRYERERLATFIEWPVAWLSPESLAKEGFYYLRDNDYCSCVFCRGIVGAWEPGDIPNREHQRHFPKCPFVRGHPVGNVPLKQGDLLASLPAVGPVSAGGTEDKKARHCDCKQILMPLPGKEKTSPPHSPKHSSPCQNALCNLPEYTGPKRKEFSTVESRIRSFKNWPKGVKQKPVELAQAGFFYCGLSDHVRCYHCGHGLRNWEATDEPWVEHARWYPKCHFVLLSKGVEFVDQVRRENPPYYVVEPGKSNSEGSNECTLQCASSGAVAPYVSHSYTADVQSNYRVHITDSQLDILMELDIQKAVLEMGFVKPAVRRALKMKIEETGVPFFNLETCIEKVLACSEDNGSTHDEAQRQQEAKIAAYQREREDRIHQSHEESLLREANTSRDIPSSAALSATATASNQLSSQEGDVVNTQHLTSPTTSIAVSTTSLLQGSRTPIITSPVMPPRRFPVSSDSTPAATSAVQEAPESGALLNANTSGTDESLNSSSELSSLENDIEVQEPMDSEDMVEFPLNSAEQNSSFNGSIASDDNVPSNDTFNDTSTPRASPTPGEYGHFDQSFVGSNPDLNVTPLLLVSSSPSTVPSSSPPTFSLPASFSSSSSSSSSTVSAAADPISLEMLRQVDRVITHAEETQKRVCRNLSNCSTTSIASSKSSVGSVDGGDHVTAMDMSSSSEGEMTLTMEEQLTEAQKKVQNLRDQVERLRELRMCKICMDAELSVVLLPCAHMATCSDCTLALSTCPICRSVIRHVIRPNVVA